MLKAPVIPLLLVGRLVHPLQLRLLGALPDHHVELWVARVTKMSSFCLFKGPRGERGPRGSTGKPGPKVRFWGA